MFRDGHYLEVIKASNNCLATAVVTIKEKTIEVKKKKVSTNKWLNLEDWADLYKVLEKAILKIGRISESSKNIEKTEWKKSVHHLDITYKFDPLENAKDATSLPTIWVTVSPAKKRNGKLESTDEISKKPKPKSDCRSFDDPIVENCENERNKCEITKKSDINECINSKESKRDKIRRYLRSENLENESLEEYVPDAPVAKKRYSESTPEYVPSKKSALAAVQVPLNIYSPAPANNSNLEEIAEYVPYFVGASKVAHEEYDPCAEVTTDFTEEYVPNSKGTKYSVEEYQPDFAGELKEFDDSYVPSNVQATNGKLMKQSRERAEKIKSHKHAGRRKTNTSSKRE